MLIKLKKHFNKSLLFPYKNLNHDLRSEKIQMYFNLNKNTNIFLKIKEKNINTRILYYVFFNEKLFWFDNYYFEEISY
jgi:hypothetical protein